jgi:phosphoribosylformylglycinamidine synthase
MAFAGGLGLRLDVAGISEQVGEVAALFAESNSRFLCEVTPHAAPAFEDLLEGIPLTRLGEVVDDGQLTIDAKGRQVLAGSREELKEAWQQPLRW